ILNPYFPENFTFLYHHLVDKFSLRGYAVKVGNEWYPYGATDFLANAGASLATLTFATFLALYTGARLKREALAAWIVAVLFLLLQVKSRRFVELFPPWALVAGVYLLASNTCNCARSSSRLTMALVSVLFVMTGAYYSIIGAREEVAGSAPYQRYQGAADWLSGHSRAHDLVFTSDWDDFPRLFHFNHHNSYLVGLDPYFLFARNQTQFLLWRHITQGKLQTHPSAIIPSQFGAHWVFVDSGHGKLRKQLRADPGAVERYRDDDASIFELVGRSESQ
ncbi:MAG: hypothetical protein KDD44_06675, partial [Bdellovibrionales bacterium]|nr:hypothetical protein [Bdellovibrionales bacterium]